LTASAISSSTGMRMTSASRARTKFSARVRRAKRCGGGAARRTGVSGRWLRQGFGSAAVSTAEPARSTSASIHRITRSAPDNWIY
jgi:hypothetical protein